jgi:VanZ family protein
VLLWAGLIFFLSSIPGTDFPATAVPQADKLAHLVIYAGLGAVIYRAIAARSSSSPSSNRRTSTALLTILLATIYGMSDEFHQAFTPHRTPDWHDVAADMLGGATGALLMRAAPWMKTRICSMMARS